MRLFGKARSRTFTWSNQTSRDLLVWLEPWAEEFEVRPGSRIDLVVSGKGAAGDIPVDVTPTHLAVYVPGQTRVRVLIDGADRTLGSDLPAPSTGNLPMRDFTGLLFSGVEEARLGGAPEAARLDMDSLGEKMADGEVRLEPLAEAHRVRLKSACAEDGEIWSIYATSWDPDHFDESFDRILSLETWRSFAIFVGDRLVGMSSFIGVDPKRGALEIGRTDYVPDRRGTGLNRIVKDLMIGRAIDCGFRRIEFKVDSRNGRSQAAMAKLGAVREGIIRSDRVTWTGHVRDTVLFSILAEEWPRRRSQ